MKAHCAPRPQPRALRGAATRTLAPLRPTRRAAVHSNRISSLQKRQFSPQRFDLMGRNAVRKSTRVPCTPSRLEENAAGRVMAPFCRHRTIPGCYDAYRQCSTRSSPRLMRGAPPRRTAACTRRPLRHGSDWVENKPLGPRPTHRPAGGAQARTFGQRRLIDTQPLISTLPLEWKKA